MKKEIMKDLTNSFFQAVNDGEVVIIDSGCGEVLEMIESCGIENVDNFAEDYEKEALKIAEKEGWETINVNNCTAVVKFIS